MEIVASLNELDKVVSYLNEVLPTNAIVFLRGDLAAGKTTLTQAVAKAKGIESRSDFSHIFFTAVLC